MAKKVNQRNDKLKIQYYILSLLILFMSIIAMFRLGSIGRLLDFGFQFGFGIMKYIIYIFMILNCLSYLWLEHLISFNKKMIGMTLVWIGISVFIPVFSLTQFGFDALSYFMSKFFDVSFFNLAGLLFVGIYAILSSLVGKIGVGVFSFILVITGIVVYFGKEIVEYAYRDTKENLTNYKEKRKIEKEEKMRFIPTYDLRKAKKIESFSFTLQEDKEQLGELISTTNADKMVIPTIKQEHKKEELPLKPSKQLTIDDSIELSKHESYNLPELNLLKEGKQKANIVNQKKAQENAVKIIDILNQFQVNATISNISIGPSVTRFEVKPDSGVRVNKIATLQHDIKMALAAKYLRIEAPIPGKSAVGIEIPNEEKEMVYMKEVIQSVKNKDSKLLFVLGKDLTGNSIYGELDKMPHLLVAGSTGSGKSVCINSIITSILLRSTPEEVRILLIDPKKVEFTPYKAIPHLVAPIITDATKASRALEVVVAEMDKRYDLFSLYGVKNMKGYHELLAKNQNADLPPMPYIMVVIDELADLMMVASKKVESSIQRITQLARAAGIHLIVATQRPSVDVITGIIKSNIPSRIAFAVSSSIDSRTILDESGAEKLLGYGDMLYIPVGEQNPIRVQGVYVSDEEVESICAHTQKYGKVEYMEVFQNLEDLDRSIIGNNMLSDDLYVEVKQFVLESRKASTSVLQRRFSIGYSRAAKLMDMLEMNGVIGPQNGTKPREIFEQYED